MNLPALFLKLLNMSISASWLVLAVILLRLVMKKAPKWMTCALWAMVAFRLVMPFSIESIFSLIPSTQTLPPEMITGNRFEIDSGIPVINHQINDVVLDSYYEGVTVPVDHGFDMMSTASLVWLIGMALLMLYTLGSYLHLRHKVKASIRLRDNIYLCDYIETPFILGIIRPKIYLPSSLEQSQWPHVIAHEQAHLKRRDHWWKPLGFLLLCIHWFNPLLWLAYILLCRDIELACDEKVIRELGDHSKKAYSEALLECSMPRYLIAACPLAFGEVGVKERVKSILNYKKPAFWVILIALILCITAAVCFLTDPVSGPETTEFTGTVVSKTPFHITIEPEAGSSEANSSDRIVVTLPENAPEIQNGDIVRIVYDGVIRETAPAQIPNVLQIEVLSELEYISQVYSLSRAIMEGYVVMVNGDVVAGQAAWQEFAGKAAAGTPASIRFATYFTIGDPEKMADELFEENRDRYPSIYFHELSYNGESYTLRWFEEDTEYVQVWKYLMHYTGTPSSPYARFLSYDCYMLTDQNNVSYDALWNGMYSADFRDQIPFRQVYMDYTYANEPDLWDLENAKSALEPYMLQYRIASLDANELTGLLDIEVYEWVDGLFALIGQYIDPQFVTVTELRGTIEFTSTSYDRIEDAILDGCVVSMNGDVVAGMEHFEAFLSQTKRGQSAAVRLVDFYTISSPVNYDPGDFPDVFRQAPSMSVTDLSFDGVQYTHRLYSEGSIYEAVFQHLLHYSTVAHGSRIYRDYYVLTDHKDLTWEEYTRGIAVSALEYPRGLSLCSEVLYANEPDLTELEQAKNALMPYMQEYQIIALTVNKLTNRLDIVVTEWVTGLESLVARFINPNFAVITHQDGWPHLKSQNDVVSRFPEYFGLHFSRGLKLYVLEDGYILLSGADQTKSETEILSMSKATAPEMALILDSYEVHFPDIFVINHTGRSEYDIRKELGIYPSCSVNADISNATAHGATITFTIHNLDDKEVWTGQEFLLEVMTEDGWVTYGYDPGSLAWDTSLLFHRVGTAANPNQTSFWTQEDVTFTFNWSTVADTPLSSGAYRFCKTIHIRTGEEIRSHMCYAFFEIP